MKKALVMGNGPSLDLLDFSILKSSDITTFACNKIAKLCQEKDWFPDYYTAFFAEPFRGTRYPGSIQAAQSARDDIAFMTQNKSTKCYLHDTYREFIADSENVNFHSPFLVNKRAPISETFFEDKKIPENFAWHVAVTPLFQLCFALGFETIGIIGQDGHDENSKNHHYEGYEGPSQSKEKFKIGNQRIIELQNAVSNYCKKNSIKIYNLSNCSVIEHYELAKFEDFLKY